MSTPVKRASSFLGPSGSMAEITYSTERSPGLQWLVQVGTNGTSAQALKPVLSLSDGSDLAPPADRHNLASKGVILLPSQVADHQDTSVLLDAMVGFINRYCDIPPLWEKLIAHYALMTWVYDKFSAVPYLRFLGEPQSGKTRCLLTSAHLCYKPVIAGGATSASPFFRLLDIWRGTFVIDEADYGKSDLWSEIIKILNQGYTTKLPVIRSEKEGTSFDPNAFDVYGPKILSTRREFEDIALESRCITLRMEDRPLAQRIPRQLPPEFYSEALSLRNRCLAWRLDNWASLQTSQDALLALSPRLTQIAIPLWAISPDPSWKLDFLEFLSGQAREQRGNSHIAVLAESLRRLTCNTVLWPAILSLKEISEACGEVAGDWGIEAKFSPRITQNLLRGLVLPSFKNRTGSVEITLTQAQLGEILSRHKS